MRRSLLSVEAGMVSVDPRVVSEGAPWKLGVSTRLPADFDPSRIQN